MNERIYLIDVSSVQKGIDWDRVVEHDPGEAFGRPPGRIRGVVAKAAEGSKGIDGRTREHIAGARIVGLSVGVYHFGRVRPLVLEAEEDVARTVAPGIGHCEDVLQHLGLIVLAAADEAVLRGLEVNVGALALIP